MPLSLRRSVSSSLYLVSHTPTSSKLPSTVSYSQRLGYSIRPVVSVVTAIARSPHGSHPASLTQNRLYTNVNIYQPKRMVQWLLTQCHGALASISHCSAFFTKGSWSAKVNEQIIFHLLVTNAAVIFTHQCVGDVKVRTGIVSDHETKQPIWKLRPNSLLADCTARSKIGYWHGIVVLSVRPSVCDARHIAAF